MRQTCTDHCSKCGQHFHGLGAFDRHLRRVAEGTNALGARTYELDHVVGPGVGLHPWTTTGHCDLTGKSGVTVWQRIHGSGDLNRLATLSAKAPSDQTPSAGDTEGA